MFTPAKGPPRPATCRLIGPLTGDGIAVTASRPAAQPVSRKPFPGAGPGARPGQRDASASGDQGQEAGPTPRKPRPAGRITGPDHRAGSLGREATEDRVTASVTFP